jgi:ribonuclease HI
MEKDELQSRLDAIVELIDRQLDAKTQLLLLQVKSIALGLEEDLESLSILKKQKPTRIIISCDASIKKNPGGPASVGVVIQRPGEKNLELGQLTNATTNNLAEYDAVYFGLTSLVGLNPMKLDYEIEVRSDSQLTIRQLTGEMKCNDPKLQNKRDLVLDYVQNNLTNKVHFVWRPRNSTPELTMANYLAQDLIDVPRH